MKVNADGSFTPQVTYIKSGDTVRWEGLTRTDSIIPANPSQTYPGICSARNPYNPADANEFTGPMPFAPSGVYTLSPLDASFIEATSSCPAGSRLSMSGDNGKVLCIGATYEATLDSTWRSPDITGVFIRLLWKDINPKAGVYDFTVLQREIEQAVKQGKLYSLGIKAGDDGTPDWIFSTNTDDTPRTGGGGGVGRLHFQDAGSDTVDVSCGVRMDLGNPTRATYRQLYHGMITEVAKFLKTRADWYRALAYMKISGANLFSHENRLPRDCSVITRNGVQTACICNPAVWAADGYRPSGLYSFYTEQGNLLRSLFPGKAMAYALIQDGFPRVSESGAYQTATGQSSNGTPIPGAAEQTQTILDGGQSLYGLSFLVQHNGLQPKGSGCAFDGTHPKPARTSLNDYDGPPGSHCPNPYVLREGAEGQITAFQTTNKSEIATATDLDLAFQNLWDNSDGVFLEIYEDVYWQAANTNKGILPLSRKTVGGWAEDLHKRRVDPIFPNFTSAGNPFPAMFSKTFKNPAPGVPLTLAYVHGMKCGAGKQEFGQIVIDAVLPAIKAGGVVSASAFGGLTTVAPGSWIEIYGTGLGSATRSWAGPDFIGVNAPTSLEGTTVRIGGQLAFIDYVSPTQVNAQVPSNVAAGTQQVTVSTGVGTSASFAVNVAAIAPGLLAPVEFNIGGKQYAVAQFPDGTFVLPPGSIAGLTTRRAKPGETITFYGVGFGAVTPNIPAGQVVQQTNALAQPFQMQFGSVRGTASYAGLAPGVIGLYQFNVVVPNVAASDAMPLTFTVGSTSGTQTLYVAVQN